jgi:hypothetical protein
MTIKHTIQKWHHFVETGKHTILDEILADDAVFHSPVLHTPQKGKTLTKMYLGAAYYVFKDTEFVYKKQILQNHQAALEFETEIDGIVINGVDIIECNDEGKIIEFKVMIRPLQGLQKLQQKMMEMLEQSKH